MSEIRGVSGTLFQVSFHFFARVFPQKRRGFIPLVEFCPLALFELICRRQISMTHAARQAYPH